MDLFASYTLQETLVLNPQLIYHSNEEFALYGYCIPVFAALSLVANSLVIRTLGFRRPHGEQPPNLSSLDLLLQHLAIYDIAVAGLRCVHFMVKKTMIWLLLARAPFMYFLLLTSLLLPGSEKNPWSLTVSAFLRYKYLNLSALY